MSKDLERRDVGDIGRAALLRARNELVERASQLTPWPDGYALMQNPTFQEALDFLDPDYPNHADTPGEAIIHYIIGEFHLNKTKTLFASGTSYEDYYDEYVRGMR